MFSPAMRSQVCGVANSLQPQLYSEADAEVFSFRHVERRPAECVSGSFEDLGFWLDDRLLD
jgi:hypothetical protein